jgi:hypothetical protein
MSLEITSLHSPIQTELSTVPTEEKIREIISLWEKRVPSLSSLIQKVLKSALDKTKRVLEYTSIENKENSLNKACHFLTIFGIYLSSLSYHPPKTMTELISGLNNFSGEYPFLKPNDTFTDRMGRIYKIIEIIPPEETFNPKIKYTKIKYASGTNM